jgi:polysaccharide pyruvyl transferase WcaK-like protein
MASGRRLILLPQTIGPFERRAARWIAGRIVRYAGRVYTRDAAGIAELRALLGPQSDGAKVRFCHDMGFVIEPRPRAGAPTVRRGANPLVGLNISGLLMMGGYTRNDMFGLGVAYAELIERLARMFVQDKNADLFLVPHVFGAHEESDVTAMRKAYETLSKAHPGRVSCALGEYDQNEIKHVIGACDFFVGSRMHACIAALSQCVPAVGIAYSDKFAGVFDSAGVGHLVVDPRKLSMDELVRAVGAAYDRRDQGAGVLRERMPHVRGNVLALLDEEA